MNSFKDWIAEMPKDIDDQPRVFVLQQPKPNAKGWMPNIQSATQFGRLHFVFLAGDQPWTDPDAALQKAAWELRTFRSERDYILWPSTDPAGLVASVVALSRMIHVTGFRLLYWQRNLTSEGERSGGFYSPIQFSLPSGFWSAEE